MQDMNWDDLRIFLALARKGKLSLAAAATGLDATTVSRRIGRLEAALDARLFELGPQGHALTASGRALLPAAETAERGALSGISGITGAHGRVGGLVRISLSEGFGTWVVARRLPEFQQAHPDITVELAVSSGFLSPSKREADIAIMLARPRAGPVVTRRLTDYMLGLYASSDHCERNGRPATVSSLQNHPLVGYIDELIYAPQLRYLDEIAPGLSPDFRSSSINAQHQMIAAGVGIGVLPCFIGDQDPRLERILPDEAEIRRSFWMVVHKDVRRLARVDAFVDWLNEIVTGGRGLLFGQIDAPSRQDVIQGNSGGRDNFNK